MGRGIVDSSVAGAAQCGFNVRARGRLLLFIEGGKGNLLPRARASENQTQTKQARTKHKLEPLERRRGGPTYARHTYVGREEGLCARAHTKHSSRSLAHAIRRTQRSHTDRQAEARKEGQGRRQVSGGKAGSIADAEWSNWKASPSPFLSRSRGRTHLEGVTRPHPTPAHLPHTNGWKMSHTNTHECTHARAHSQTWVVSHMRARARTPMQARVRAPAPTRPVHLPPGLSRPEDSGEAGRNRWRLG